jgi:TetR/AcrR family transcriptional repressor of nem operon
MKKIRNTKAEALAETRNLVQTFGFNGFSFQKLADVLHIKKPSLFSHFRSKEDLGKSMLESYRLSFIDWSETIKTFPPDAQINALFETFFKFSAQLHKICPLSAMAADLNSLPDEIKVECRKLFDTQLLWLQKIIEAGQMQKIFRNDKSEQELAYLIQSISFGSQLLARMAQDPDLVQKQKFLALEILTLGVEK